MEIRKMLKFYRKKSNFTQKEIAEYLKIAKSTYANYEQGSRGGQITATQILLLCQLYLITPNELLDYNEER